MTNTLICCVCYFSQGSVGVQYAVEFDTPVTESMALETGAVVLKYLIANNNQMLIGEDMVTVTGSYVFPTDPNNATNITACKYHNQA